MKTFYISNLEEAVKFMNSIGDVVNYNAAISHKHNTHTKISLIALGISSVMMNNILKKHAMEIRNLKQEIKELKETKGE